MKTKRIAMMCVGFVGWFAQPVVADEVPDPVHDGSSAAAAGFLATVTEARGVVLRVPVNRLGEENTSEASLRLYEGEFRPDVESREIETIWNAARDLRSTPEVNAEAIRDGATWGWNQYRYHHGWRG